LSLALVAASSSCSHFLHEAREEAEQEEAWASRDRDAGIAIAATAPPEAPRSSPPSH
jgi:hypothetical protein